jgi:hypothetical protein
VEQESNVDDSGFEIDDQEPQDLTQNDKPESIS